MLNTYSARRRNHLYFIAAAVCILVIFRMPVKHLISFSLAHDYGSHIALVAPISAYLIYVKRREIFAKTQANRSTGASLLLAGTLIWLIADHYSRVWSDLFSIEIAAIILLLIAAFILCYGTHAFRAARFPLFFLALMIPVPEFLIGKIILFLQAGSAEVAYGLFKVLAVPVFKDGFAFLLPTLSIEVAQECSGIRSSIVLLITTLIAGEFVLQSLWRKSLFVLTALPILILKNGLRIVTISLLTIYVDPGFMHGWLHTSGGMVFYALGLLALLPVLTVLKKGEMKRSKVAGHKPIRGGATPPPRYQVGTPELTEINQ